MVHTSEFVPPWLRGIDWKIPRLKKLQPKIDSVLQKIVDEHKLGVNSSKEDFMHIMLKHVVTMSLMLTGLQSREESKSADSISRSSSVRTHKKESMRLIVKSSVAHSSACSSSESHVKEVVEAILPWHEIRPGRECKVLGLKSSLARWALATTTDGTIPSRREKIGHTERWGFLPKRWRCPINGTDPLGDTGKLRRRC
ncbi:hypothetical protein SELMODRAFT_428160 [Selaginella moellendorffii]|uniref:Uncharacterized protein n=1 Tax=Selaginella moellendorffii TaxID=88036 RepID=D8T1Y2_SELML|nr:hypothetical protein SELMODRAFT_428160 [Selaginella moellendorffii]